MKQITLVISCLVASIMFSFCSNSKQNSNWQLPKIPTKNEVGKTVLPENIDVVKAPFKTIDFSKPIFPSDTIKLELSETEINTSIINNAINLLSEKGGGTILIPDGEWNTGRVELKSNVNLSIPEKATLKFSSWVKDFQPAVFTRSEGVEVMSLGACIYANGQENIAITGNGKLVGPTAQEGDIIERIERSSVIENVVAANTPVSERIFDGNQPSGSIFPPMFISPINCNKVYVEGVSLSYTAFWNIVPIYCNNIIIRGIEVNSVGIPRGDGIDIESSKNVLIEYCTLSSGDDCFTMKAGRGEDGVRVNKSTENVVVRYCLAKEGHGGITCGSETAGIIKNIYVHDCVFDNTGVGVRFKTRRSRAGGGDSIFYERIRMNLKATAFKWDMLGNKLYVGDLAKRLPALPVDNLTPKYSNIVARDFIIENCTNFVTVLGIPESPMEGLVLENIVIENALREVFRAHDLKDAIIRNIKIMSSDSVLDLTDSRNISFENIEFNNANGARMISKIQGELSDSIKIESCTNIDNKVFSKSNK